MIKRFKTEKEVCDFYKLKELTQKEAFKNKDILGLLRVIGEQCSIRFPDYFLVFENEIKTQERLNDVINSLMLQNNLKNIFKEFRVSATEEMIYCVFKGKKRVNKIKFSDIGICDGLIYGRTKTRIIKFFTWSEWRIYENFI